MLLFGLLLSLLVNGKAEAHTVPVAHKTHYWMLASWYNLPGRTMADGKIFKEGDPTIAANLSLPFGTVLWVKNPHTGKVLKVIVQDRGPARRTGRQLDLSEAAANILGYTLAGVVHLEVVAMQPPK